MAMRAIQKLAKLLDVVVSGLADGHLLRWSAASGKFVVGSATVSDAGELTVRSNRTGNDRILSVTTVGGVNVASFGNNNSTGFPVGSLRLHYGTDTAEMRATAANQFTLGGTVCVAPTAATCPLVARGAASQSTDICRIERSDGAAYWRVSMYGGLVGANGAFMCINGTALADAGVTAYTRDPAAVGIVVKASGSAQTADLQQWQNSGGTVQFAVGATGEIKTNQTVGAAGVNSINSVLRIYDAAGGLIGYVPIYQTFIQA